MKRCLHKTYFALNTTPSKTQSNNEQPTNPILLLQAPHSIWTWPLRQWSPARPLQSRPQTLLHNLHLELDGRQTSVQCLVGPEDPKKRFISQVSKLFVLQAAVQFLQFDGSCSISEWERCHGECHLGRYHHVECLCQPILPRNEW